MSRPTITNTLRVSQRELEAMLTALEGSGARGGDSRRKARRWGMIGNRAVLTVFQQVGAPKHFLVATRNLSSTGIGLVHGGFIHPKSRCVVSLRTRKGEARSVEGEVVTCRLMKAHFHEVGVRFDAEINPREFVQPSSEASFNVERVDPDQLYGKVLMVDDDRSIQKLTAHHLSDTHVELQFADDPATGIESLADNPDLVFIDHRFPEGTGLEFIVNARKQNFMAPIIMLTADTSQSLRTRVVEAGGNELLRKPCPRELLLQALAEYLLGESPASENHTLIVSDLTDKDVPMELVESYVEELRARTDEVADAIERGDADEIKRILMNVVGSAGAHGFEPIVEIANTTHQAVEAADKLEDAMTEVQAFVGACFRARARSLAADIAERTGADTPEGEDEPAEQQEEAA